MDATAIGTLDAYDRDEWGDDENIVIENADALRLANRYLVMNMPDASLKTIQVDESHVTIKAKATAKVFFMAMFGKEDFKLEATARALLDDD